MSFSDEVEAWVRGTKEKIDADVRAITLELFSSVILGSPVDNGLFRGNWQTDVGTPNASQIERLDVNGNAAIADVSANMSGAGGISWLTNNLPYAEVLEYGKYPNPPKKGTYIRGKLGRKRKDGSRRRAPGSYEIRSEGGFSKQAPAGFVRINMERISANLRSLGWTLS